MLKKYIILNAIKLKMKEEQIEKLRKDLGDLTRGCRSGSWQV